MAWTAPMTAVTGNVFTAAQFNQHVRDNLLVTEAAIAAQPMGLLVTTGANGVAFRIPDLQFVGVFESTTSTSYGDLTTFGPSVSITTGTKALVSFGAQVWNSSAGLGTRMAYEISGATTLAATDQVSYYTESGNANDGFQGTWTYVNKSITAGLNLFTAKYRAVGGGTATFGHRLLAVVSFC